MKSLQEFKEGIEVLILAARESGFPIVIGMIVNEETDSLLCAWDGSYTQTSGICKRISDRRAYYENKE